MNGRLVAWGLLALRRRVSSKAGVLVKTFDKTVDPFSKIRVETPMSVRVEPLDALDRLELSLYGRGCDFKIEQSAQRVDLVGTGAGAEPDPDAVCVLRAPPRASFDIRATGASSIHIARMHSDECHLRTDSGDVHLRDLRGGALGVTSLTGHIQCAGTVHMHSVDIRTGGAGAVRCEHLRAHELSVATDSGDISADSCYADASRFATALGSMRLANVHRRCRVEILERGDLTIQGFDGALEATLKRGNVHLRAARLHAKNSVFVHESGSIDVSVARVEGEIGLLELIGKKLNIADVILRLGKVLDDGQHSKFRYEDERHSPEEEERAELYVENRNGTIEIRIASWKDALEREMGANRK